MVATVASGHVRKTGFVVVGCIDIEFLVDSAICFEANVVGLVAAVVDEAGLDETVVAVVVDKFGFHCYRNLVGFALAPGKAVVAAVAVVDLDAEMKVVDSAGMEHFVAAVVAAEIDVAAATVVAAVLEAGQSL